MADLKCDKPQASTRFATIDDRGPLDGDALSEKARWVRATVLEMIVGANKGHIGGSLSSTDILISLYQGGVLNVDPRNPKLEERDRFIFSKGHSAESLYAVLADMEYFSTDELMTYGRDGSILGGHVDNNIPGIEVSTGSLGHGLSIGAGLALSARLDGKDYRVYALLGDGECYEGSVWEGAMFAAHHRLSNLAAIVDRNRQITLNYTEDINELDPFVDKWKAFNWDVHVVDGHSIPELIETFQDLKHRESDRPAVVIANTVKGKGVSFMEGNLHWHHNVPKPEQVEIARKELGTDAR